MLVPIGIAIAAAAPLLHGSRGDLETHAPLLTWGAMALQALLGLWLLALGFREAVPGANVSGRALAIAGVLTGLWVAVITVSTNAASPTTVPTGREWRDWAECVVWPTAIGAPFMILATLMTARAFPTRPAVAGGLCGLAAGVLSDAGVADQLLDLEPRTRRGVASPGDARAGGRRGAARHRRRLAALEAIAPAVTRAVISRHLSKPGPSATDSIETVQCPADTALRVNEP